MHIPLRAANFEFYSIFLAFLASNNHLLPHMGQLKNIWSPKAAHNNLGWPLGPAKIYSGQSPPKMFCGLWPQPCKIA